MSFRKQLPRTCYAPDAALDDEDTAVTKTGAQPVSPYEEGRAAAGTGLQDAAGSEDGGRGHSRGVRAACRSRTRPGTDLPRLHPGAQPRRQAECSPVRTMLDSGHQHAVLREATEFRAVVRAAVRHSYIPRESLSHPPARFRSSSRAPECILCFTV